MSTCSICLSDVRPTRNNPPIRCGHVFHSDCLQHWKDQGKNTCPTCRKVFDVMDIFDISFDVEDVLDLDALLLDIGSSLSDIDPLVLNTE